MPTPFPLSYGDVIPENVQGIWKPFKGPQIVTIALLPYEGIVIRTVHVRPALPGFARGVPASTVTPTVSCGVGCGSVLRIARASRAHRKQGGGRGGFATKAPRGGGNARVPKSHPTWGKENVVLLSYTFAYIKTSATILLLPCMFTCCVRTIHFNSTVVSAGRKI